MAAHTRKTKQQKTRRYPSSPKLPRELAALIKIIRLIRRVNRLWICTYPFQPQTSVNDTCLAKLKCDSLRLLGAWLTRQNDCSAGEVRNQIYELVLADSIAVEVVYRSTCNKFYVAGRRYLSHNTIPQKTMRNLQALAQTNRTLRIEARSFYYANNSFDVAHEGVRFLRAIGSLSRSNISSLRLDEVYSLKPLSNYSNTRNQELLLLLEQCTNLKHLSIVLPLELDLRVDLEWKDLIAAADVSAVTNFFRRIKCLKGLEIILVFSKPSGIVISPYRRYPRYYRLEEDLSQIVQNDLLALYPQADVSVSANLSYKWG
jgi:hypothetical protein